MLDVICLFSDVYDHVRFSNKGPAWVKTRGRVLVDVIPGYPHWSVT
jgi:hypothetical protein